jgi:hypothetical protein
MLDLTTNWKLCQCFFPSVPTTDRQPSLSQALMSAPDVRSVVIAPGSLLSRATGISGVESFLSGQPMLMAARTSKGDLVLTRSKKPAVCSSIACASAVCPFGAGFLSFAHQSTRRLPPLSRKWRRALRFYSCAFFHLPLVAR